MKKILSTIIIAFSLIFRSYSQDIGINIGAEPGAVETKSGGKVLVSLCNTGGITLQPYRIRPLISISSDKGVTITGISDLPAGWFICSGVGTATIRISNGTGTVPITDCVEFNIDYITSSTTGTAYMTGTVSFAGGTQGTACNNGPPTPGNNTANDNSTGGVVISAPLPLNLLSFKGKQLDEFSNLITWKTANEKAFSHFSIRSSSYLKEFVEIGTVKGGSENGNYEFKDDKFPPGKFTYYQLKMVDIDGTVNYSKIVAVAAKENTFFASIENPVKDGVLILKTDMIAPSFLFMTATGQKLEAPVIANFDTNYKINVKQMPAGIYYLKIYSNQTSITKKVLIN